MAAATLPKPSKSARTRGQILEAAERCFAAKGFAGTRLEDVGGEIGIAASAILYHFRGKQDLYRAVIQNLFEGLLERFEDALAGSGRVSQRVERTISIAVRYVAKRPTGAKIALREAMTDDPQLRTELQNHAVPFIALLKRIFNEGQSSGEFRQEGLDPFRFISAIAGTIVFYFAALPTFARTLPYEHLADQQISKLEENLLDITRSLLGVSSAQTEASI